MAHIKKLYDRGIKNGVKNLKIISQDELHEMEPEVNPDATGALFAPTAGIVSPYQATWAIAENAVQNGVKLFLDSEVHSLTPPKTAEKDVQANPTGSESSGIDEKLWTIHTGKQEIKARCVINAAGLFADRISKMAGARNFEIKARRGEYFLLDNKCSYIASHTLFQTPDEKGKGILVTPTVDGNILVGPTADDGFEKTDTATTRSGQNFAMEKGEKTIPGIPRRNIINSFSGMRALAYDEDGKQIKDFIIEEDKNVPAFINVAGICSPGLTAAPAIGEYVSEMARKILCEKFGMKIEPNTDFIAVRKGIESFKDASVQRKAELIEENPLYGRIICRCEMITEAEIVQAINSTVGACDLDGIKRRTRAGMGRCQGGFCSPRVTEIIAREKNIPMTSVTKNGGASYILNSKTR
jgi:glycerol-3-phosphate dehydrogenase